MRVLTLFRELALRSVQIEVKSPRIIGIIRPIIGIYSDPQHVHSSRPMNPPLNVEPDDLSYSRLCGCADPTNSDDRANLR